MSLTVRRASALACLTVLAVFGAVVGQEPILTLALDETEITIPQGDAAIAILRLENTSVYPADHIEAGVDIEGIILDAEPAEIEVLQPFDVTTMTLRLSATEELQLGTSSHELEILYTYCIGELCFQIFEVMPLSLTIEPPTEIPSERPIVPSVEAIPTRWIRLGGLGLGLLLLAAVIAIRRAFSTSWPLYGVLILFAVGGLAYGVALNQHEQAQGIGAVLCTSCVGIEEAQRGEASLTAAGIAAIEAVEREIELLVFHAEWCHACPFAEAMVEEVASHNRLITYRFVDVEEQPDLAEENGVIRSGRTVVPAILRVDNGAILFGAEDLEARLVDLLEGES